MTLPPFVGRYEIRGEIASGGFAVVALAWDEELESLVAIKILHPHLARDQTLLQRFIEEARLLRRVRAPNVVTVHDIGRLADGRPYFVLDYADRGTLETRLQARDGPVEAGDRGLVRLAEAIADGLTALHEVGLVHRDIKPANILFQGTPRTPVERPADPGSRLAGDHERILVGDLGLARDIVTHGDLPTLVGGTPLYRAPEQSDPGAVAAARR